MIPTQNGETTKLQMDYSKWGDKVTIEAPSKAKITKNSLLNRLGEPTDSPTP